MERQIPIQNLYYLLCYAWGLPEQRDWLKVDADSCPAVLDLLSRLLTKGADVLLKRGIAKEYRTHEEEITGIKGKLELAKTIKANQHREGKTICMLDDLSGDILLNQVVYTTMYRLLGNKDLDKNVKKTYSVLFADSRKSTSSTSTEAHSKMSVSIVTIASTALSSAFAKCCTKIYFLTNSVLENTIS